MKQWPAINPAHIAAGALLALVLASLFTLAPRDRARAEPADAHKPKLAYLLSLDGNLQDLARGAGLTPGAKAKVVKAVRQADEQLLELGRASNLIVGLSGLTALEKRGLIGASNYNARVAGIEEAAMSRVKQLASRPGKVDGWIAAQWEAEVSAHGVAGHGDAGILGVRHKVYATQYLAYSDYEVAIPDKYVKFANLDLEHQPGYKGRDFTVDLVLSGTKVRGVKVLDVGPWNIDDNYWNVAGAKVRPRRLFTDLSEGMPESQAAFFDDYNGGKDQFDRVVLNPAGIDLSPEVAADLGLAFMQNAWVNVTFNWETGQALKTKMSAPKYSTSLSKSRIFRVAWRLRDRDFEDLVAGYEVQYRAHNRAQWRQLRSQTPARSAKFMGKAGITYFFRVRAWGKNGKAGIWSKRKKTIIPYDQNHIMTKRRGFGFQFYGPRSAYYLRGVRYSRTKGTFVEFEFTGKNVALVSRRGPGRSKAKIYVDGKYAGTIDAYAPSEKARRILFRRFWREGGFHTLRVKNMATPGRKRFDIDGVAVGR